MDYARKVRLVRFIQFLGFIVVFAALFAPVFWLRERGEKEAVREVSLAPNISDISEEEDSAIPPVISTFCIAQPIPLKKERSITLSGFIQGEGKPVSGAVVYAYFSSEAKIADEEFPTPNVSAVTGDDGRYMLTFPDLWPPFAIDLGAVASGFLREFVQDLRISEETVTRDFLLTRGDRIRGRIVDLEGNPVPNLPLLATRKNIPKFTPPMMSSALLRTVRFRYAPRGSEYHESRGITDANGDFEITGLGAGEKPYTLVADCFEWLLDPACEVRAGDLDILATAMKPLGLTGAARDSSTKQLIPNVFVMVTVLSPSGNSYMVNGGAPEGKIGFAWKHWEETVVPDELRYRVRVSAPRYRGWEEKIVVNTNESFPSINCELISESVRDVEFLITSHGLPCEVRKLVLRYAPFDPSTPEDKGGIAELTRGSEKYPGSYYGKVPTGRWYFRVGIPHFPVSDFSSEKQEAEVTEEETTVVEIALPPFGELTLPPFEASVDDPTFLWIVGERLTTNIKGVSGGEEIEIPPGTWRLSLTQGKNLLIGQTITISGGESVTAELLEK